MNTIDLGIKSIWFDFEAWLDSWVPHYPKAQYLALAKQNDALRERERLLEASVHALSAQWLDQRDQLAAKTLELETLKNKIVERAQVQPIIKAKSAAEIRRYVEQQNEREFEESANG